MPEMKRCTKCGEEKPATREFFSPQKRMSSGLASWCKPCCNQQKREAYKLTPEVFKERSRQCVKDLSPEEFRARRRRYVSKYRETHLEQERERAKAGKRKERRENPEKFRAIWASERAKRNALEGSFSGHDLKAQLIKQDFKCFYCHCRVTKTGRPWHADHFIPISKGGTNYADNIVIACQDCNLQKHDKMPWEWMPDKFQSPNQ